MRLSKQQCIGSLLAFAATVMPVALTAQTNNEEAAYADCRAQSKASDDFNRCVADRKLSLDKRRGECIKEVRAWDLPGARVQAAYQACMGSESVAHFRASMQAGAQSAPQARGGDAPVSKGVPVAFDESQLAIWYGYDGAAKLVVSTVFSALWAGPMLGDAPNGPGRLTVRFEYVTRDFNGSRRQSGEIAVLGDMRGAKLQGPVELLAHPALPVARFGSVLNVFDSGRNLGIPLSTECAPSLPELHANADVTWLGNCRGTVPNAGLAVFSRHGRAFDLACYSGGKFAERSEVEGFAPCEIFWSQLPGFCSVGEYRGQCTNGKPGGVGVWREVKNRASFDQTGGGVFGAMAATFDPGIRSYYIRRGQFENGSLAGFGYSGSVENCGKAGCSGDRTSQVGWFQGGELKFSCATYAECLTRTSGSNYTAGLRAAATGANAQQLAELRGRSDFGSALSAFRISGERPDLQRAAQLASGSIEQSQLEAELMRIAGYDKVFSIAASVTSPGRQQVDLSEKERLLGFMRSTSADVPLVVNWRIANRSDTVAIKHGSYRVNFSVGVRVRMVTRSCLGNACRDDASTNILKRDLVAVINAREPTASGNFDLRTTVADARVMFGMAMQSSLVDAAPFLDIQSVEKAP